MDDPKPEEDRPEYEKINVAVPSSIETKKLEKEREKSEPREYRGAERLSCAGVEVSARSGVCLLFSAASLPCVIS